MKEEMAMQELLHGKQSSKTAVTLHLTEGQVATIKDGVKHYITGDTNNLEVSHYHNDQNLTHATHSLIVYVR